MNKTRNTVPKRSEACILLTKFVNERDAQAFARIVHKYEDLVWNICCRVLHNRHDAEDAFQSTFLLLASKAHRIRKPKSLSSWLYGVAFRTASSIRRRRQRDMLPYETSVDPGLAEDVLQFVARKNENELVSAEIMLMKDKHKTPLLMFYFQGESTSQIAETLGISVSAVEGRLRQARRALRSQLRLRGIDFDQTCAALVVPVLALSPSLSAATISNAVTASVSGVAGTVYGFLTGLNQTGAKLMLTKIAVSFSLVCMATMGVLQHSDSSDEAGALITCIEGSDAFEAGTVPIKFVQNDDEEEASDDLHNHLMKVHDQLYGMWRQFTESFSQDNEVEPRHLEFDFAFPVEQADTEDTEVFGFYRPGLLHGNRNHESLESAGEEINECEYELTIPGNPPTTSRLTYVVSLPKIEVKNQIPIISDLPIIGKMFEQKGKYRLKLKATDSESTEVPLVLKGYVKDDEWSDSDKE